MNTNGFRFVHFRFLKDVFVILIQEQLFNIGIHLEEERLVLKNKGMSNIIWVIICDNWDHFNYLFFFPDPLNLIQELDRSWLRRKLIITNEYQTIPESPVL